MAKIKGNKSGEANWSGEYAKCDKCRNLLHRDHYDVSVTDERGSDTGNKEGHQVQSLRMGEKMMALMSGIVDSKLSPEFKNIADVMRGFCRDGIARWYTKQDFPENSKHGAVKSFLLHFAEMEWEMSLQKDILGKIENALRRYPASKAEKMIGTALKDMPPEIQKWAHEAIEEWEDENEGFKNRKDKRFLPSQVKDMIKVLREKALLDEMYGE